MTEDDTGGSEKKTLTTTEEPGKTDDSVIGKIQLTFHKEGLVEMEVLELGLLTLGRLEQALPQIYRQLMLARAAHQRKLDGHPEVFNI